MVIPLELSHSRPLQPEAVEEAPISTIIGAEIKELDKIGFDEIIIVDESNDLPYKLDAE
jgi:hypothetical protein